MTDSPPRLAQGPAAPEGPLREPGRQAGPSPGRAASLLAGPQAAQGAQGAGPLPGPKARLAAGPSAGPRACCLRGPAGAFSVGQPVGPPGALSGDGLADPSGALLGDGLADPQETFSADGLAGPEEAFSADGLADPSGASPAASAADLLGGRPAKPEAARPVGFPGELPQEGQAAAGRAARPVWLKALGLAIWRERLSIFSLALFILAWEAVCYHKIIGPYQLVPPSRVVKVFILKLAEVNPDGAYLWAHALSSLGLAALGFSSAALVGVPLGLLMGWYPRFNFAARPIFDAIRPIPPIAWIPLAILWLGIGTAAKGFIIFLASFVPCVINSFTGARLANPVLARVARAHGASDFKVFLKIGVPSAIPMIFTGLRLSLNAAWTTLVAAELLAASQGLGFMIQMGRRLARPDIVIVGMLAIGFLGALLSWGLTKAERAFVSSRRLA